MIIMPQPNSKTSATLADKIPLVTENLGKFFHKIVHFNLIIYTKEINFSQINYNCNNCCYAFLFSKDLYLTHSVKSERVTKVYSIQIKHLLNI